MVKIMKLRAKFRVIPGYTLKIMEGKIKIYTNIMHTFLV